MPDRRARHETKNPSCLAKQTLNRHKKANKAKDQCLQNGECEREIADKNLPEQATLQPKENKRGVYCHHKHSINSLA